MKQTAYDPEYAEKLGGGTTVGSAIGGDLSGSIPDPVVVGIQGIPVCDTPPVTNDTLVFDGIEWCPASQSASGGEMVPFYIPTDEVFTVPIYKQALFAEPIEVDGALTVLGLLVGVD